MLFEKLRIKRFVVKNLSSEVWDSKVQELLLRLNCPPYQTELLSRHSCWLCAPLLLSAAIYYDLIPRQQRGGRIRRLARLQVDVVPTVVVGRGSIKEGYLGLNKSVRSIVEVWNHFRFMRAD